MLANAHCGDRVTARSLDVLSRQGRTTLRRGEVAVSGRRAAHTVLEGRLSARDEPVRVETYVMKDARCVYDFAYAAPGAGGR